MHIIKFFEVLNMTLIILENDYETIGTIEIDDIENVKDVSGLCLNDIEDNIIRVSLEDSTAFESLNHESCVTPLEQELGAYKALKKSFLRGTYRDCSTLIRYYFGHISYGAEFGYCKTHDEICLILYETLLYSIETGKSSFIDFVDRMIAKIEWNLEHQDFVNKNMKIREE